MTKGALMSQLRSTARGDASSQMPLAKLKRLLFDEPPKY